jgi:hypothetical protein
VQDSAWFPQARRVDVGGGCGAMRGGPPRAVHHTTEGSTIDGAVATYRKTGNYPTLTIDYAKDDVVQHLPANVGATAVKNAAGGVDTNREGLYCIQVEWVGQAAHPFTSDGRGGLKPAGPKVRAFLDWLRSLGIPDAWPMGAPKAYPGSYGLNNGDRDPKVWASKAGHYGHSQVPENEHGDPGAVDPSFVRQTNHAPTAPSAAPQQSKPTPAPAPTSTEDSVFIVRGSSAAQYVTDFITKRHVTNMAELHDLQQAGVKTVKVTDATLAAIVDVESLVEPKQ